MAERRDHEDERHDRPEHDDVGDQEPDREAVVLQPAEERGVPRQDAVGEAPPRLHHRPEERGEEEAPGEERVDVAPAAHAVLGHEDVEGVGEGAGERRGDSHAVERAAAAPDLGDEREAAEGQRERVPEPPSYGLVDEEARPERDQHGGEVLDDERDPDVEVRDRREVEEVDEGEAADPEDGEVAELPARDAKACAARRSPRPRRGGSRRRSRGLRPAGAPRARRSRPRSWRRSRSRTRVRSPRGRARIPARGGGARWDPRSAPGR